MSIETLAKRPKAMRSDLLFGAFFSASTFVYVILAITGSSSHTAGHSDMIAYHLPTIRRIATQLPFPNLVNIQTATTPLFHIIFSPFARAGMSTIELQILNSVLSALIVTSIALLLRKTVGVIPAVVIVSCLALSPYYVQSAAWLNTDDFAIGFCAFALFEVVGKRRAAVVSVWLTLAVLTRQTTAWLEIVVFVLCLYDHGWRATALFRRWFAIALIPPTCALSIFAVAWRGLTPPDFRDINSGHATPCAPVYVFALAAFVLPVFIFSEKLFRRVLASPYRALFIMAVSVILASIPESAESKPDGRFGGILWSIARHAPIVSHRSVALIVLAAIGALLVFSFDPVSDLGVPDGHRVKLLLISGILGICAVQAMSSDLFQRYVELPLLLLGFVSLSQGRPLGRGRVWSVGAGVGVQALFTAAIVALHN